MKTIRLTSKRQATFPRELCEQLKLAPGSRVRLERALVEGRIVWVIRPEEPDWSWVGAARRYAKGKSHRWADIEKSIERGMAGRHRP